MADLDAPSLSADDLSTIAIGGGLCLVGGGLLLKVPAVRGLLLRALGHPAARDLAARVLSGLSDSLRGAIGP